MRILYEDNHLLAVVKPPNLPVQADSSGDEDLLTLAKAYIKQKYSKPGEVYLGLVHRLDRPVGGVVLLARTSKAAARLSAQFSGRQARKRYLAVLTGNAPGGRLEGFIAADAATGEARLCREGEPGAKAASLSYIPCARREGLTLAAVALHTGRKHQIRLQMSGAGHPIWGDQRYNPAAKPGQQIALWACSLTIDHPTLHTPITFRSLPEGGIWERFAGELPAAAEGIGMAYMDEDILIPFKPAGLQTAAADGEGESLEALLTGLYGPAYPAHRLDANTTGLVLFARNRPALEALEGAIARRELVKRYRCTVKGRPNPPRGRLVSYGKKLSDRAYVEVYDSPVPGAKEMITLYRTISTKGELSEVEAELVTGRTHQLRAQFAHMGCPILGDDRYGDRELNRRYGRREQALCAFRIELRFPPDSPLARLNGLAAEL